MLTFIGLLGSGIVAAGFVLGKSDNSYFLLSIFGFAVQWFGDSLDGRIAYYRNTPRKWFGFTLDLIIDWISTILISVGFFYYLPDSYKILAFTYAAGYGWLMLLALLRYKITGKYTIDPGLIGPTEFRVAVCLVFLAEVFHPGILIGFAVVINIVLIIINLIEFTAVLKLGDARDKEDRTSKTDSAS